MLCAKPFSLVLAVVVALIAIIPQVNAMPLHLRGLRGTLQSREDLKLKWGHVWDSKKEIQEEKKAERGSKSKWAAIWQQKKGDAVDSVKASFKKVDALKAKKFAGKNSNVLNSHKENVAIEKAGIADKVVSAEKVACNDQMNAEKPHERIEVNTENFQAVKPKCVKNKPHRFHRKLNDHYHYRANDSSSSAVAPTLVRRKHVLELDAIRAHNSTWALAVNDTFAVNASLPVLATHDINKLGFNDTFSVNDTLSLNDTIAVNSTLSTVFVNHKITKLSSNDTLALNDTLAVNSTVFAPHSIHKSAFNDTLALNDTLAVNSSFPTIFSKHSMNKLALNDSLAVNDTLAVKVSLPNVVINHRINKLAFNDTFSFNDTLSYNDTLSLNDTFSLNDSFSVNSPLPATRVHTHKLALNDTLSFNDTLAVNSSKLNALKLAFNDTLVLNDTLALNSSLASIPTSTMFLLNDTDAAVNMAANAPAPAGTYSRIHY